MSQIARRPPGSPGTKLWHLQLLLTDLSSLLLPNLLWAPLHHNQLLQSALPGTELGVVKRGLTALKRPVPEKLGQRMTSHPPDVEVLMVVERKRMLSASPLIIPCGGTQR